MSPEDGLSNFLSAMLTAILDLRELNQFKLSMLPKRRSPANGKRSCQALSATISCDRRSTF
jgi:hypothetical protein